ncbi:MAG: MBL fold metallo-hydrolase [Desulfobulbaceae bacterium]|nr:MBL fold metallo-hydrolase [Desulfobulbaceae bacterium]
MKRFSPVSAVLIVLFLASLAPAQGLTLIADNVYSYVGAEDASAAHSFGANAGIVVGSDGVLVVDTLISTREAARFLADIRTVTDKPIRYVVNTHTHLDHAFGNSFFASLGATVISHVADREYFAKTGEETLQKASDFGLTAEDMAGTRIALPKLTFTNRMQINLGDVEVELIRVAPSHTAGSLVVSIPDRKVIFAGDILFTDSHPFLAEGDLDGWQSALDDILAMDIENIIPGHGPLSTRKDIREMKEYLAAFDQLAGKLSATSQDADAIAAEIIKTLPKRSQGEWMVSYNIKSRYLGSRE